MPTYKVCSGDYTETFFTGTYEEAAKDFVVGKTYEKLGVVVEVAGEGKPKYFSPSELTKKPKFLLVNNDES